ncbi:hypothetical protein BDR03DRAFT_944630 [Suillus americanus]|nr:hypothetical protein BDR03DRAFT_944630 [Suillus americanus]
MSEKIRVILEGNGKPLVKFLIFLVHVVASLRWIGVESAHSQQCFAAASTSSSFFVE